MRIEKLYNFFPKDGAVAFVLGTGPSMRCFPVEALKGAYIVGLNQAWKYVTPNLNLTAHPELYTEWQEHPHAQQYKTQWVIKKKPPLDHLELDDPEHYVYLTNPDVNTVAERPADTLYLGEGIQCTAIDLLARMGATVIILVGCDMTSLDGNYHGHDQHTRWLGQQPDEQYALYRKTTARTRSLVRDKFGVFVLTLSPFIGLNGAVEDFHRLKGELGLKPLPKPRDISPYTRKKKK